MYYPDITVYTVSRTETTRGGQRYCTATYQTAIRAQSDSTGSESLERGYSPARNAQQQHSSHIPTLRIIQPSVWHPELRTNSSTYTAGLRIPLLPAQPAAAQQGERDITRRQLQLSGGQLRTTDTMGLMVALEEYLPALEPFLSFHFLLVSKDSRIVWAPQVRLPRFFDNISHEIVKANRSFEKRFRNQQ